MREVFGKVGIQITELREPRISVLIRLTPGAKLDVIAAGLAAQTYREFDVVLISERPLRSREVERIGKVLPSVPVKVLVGTGDDLCQGISGLSAEYLAFMDSDDSYGPDYLMDHALAAQYSGAEFIGKHTFISAEADDRQLLKQAGHEFQYVSSVQSATLIAKKAALTDKLVHGILDNRTFRGETGRILSIDRFGYVRRASCGIEKPAPNGGEG